MLVQGLCRSISPSKIGWECRRQPRRSCGESLQVRGIRVVSKDVTLVVNGICPFVSATMSFRQSYTPVRPWFRRRALHRLLVDAPSQRSASIVLLTFALRLVCGFLVLRRLPRHNSPEEHFTKA